MDQQVERVAGLDVHRDTVVGVPGWAALSGSGC